MRTQQGNLLHDVTKKTVSRDLDDNFKNTAKEMTTLLLLLLLQ